MLSAEETYRRIAAKDAAFFSSDPEVQGHVGKFLGWVDAPDRSRRELQSFIDCKVLLKSEGFSRAVVVGMGGSSLSSLVWRALARGGMELAVCDSTNPADILRVFSESELDRTVFIVASKSGTTVEPLALEEFFYERVCEALGAGCGRHFIAVTDPGSEMEARARARSYRHVFLGEPTVGGRFSALSVYGLLPACLAGLDVGSMLDAAGEAAARDGVARGLRWAAHVSAGRSVALLSSHPQAYSLCLWAEQLIAESTGKNGVGIQPVAALEQTWCENERSTFVEPVAWGSEAVVAAEMASLMVATAVAGQALGVNPFDQPDVQSAKDVAKAKLDEVRRVGALDLGQSATRLGEARSAVEGLLTGMGDEGYVAILAYLAETDRSVRGLCRLQSTVMTRYGVPCTLGFGPRYLHSTGQFHKGGPPSGRFLVLTCEDVEDVSIPGMGASFGQLCGAQALGDVETLRSRGLSVVHVHLDSPLMLDGLLAALGVS